MKKFTKIFFTLLLIGAVGFVMCGILLDWFTTEDTVIPATCTEQGYTLHRGWFGVESQTDLKAPFGHRYDVTVTAPTCREGGSSYYLCADCGHSYTGDPTEPTGHSYIKTTLTATCTDTGHSTYTCSVCGDCYTGDETAAHGHVYVSTTVLPGCETAGYTEHVCGVCGDSYRDSETAALGHLNVTEVTEATCLTPGYTLTVCKRCEHATLSPPQPALGHNYIDYIVNATCTTAGYTNHICSRCPSSYIDERIEARGHNYIPTKITATTAHAGGTRHTCSRCGDNHMTDVYTFAEVFDGRQGNGEGVLAEGIDLSHNNDTNQDNINQEVDFKALKASGISFVILRVGTSRTPDRMFETYYEQAREAGLDIGAYIFTYAQNIPEALDDAAWMIEKLEGKTFEYPIFFDIESKELTSLSKDTLTEIALAFCETMVDAGYYPGVYTNPNWIANHLNIDQIRKSYDIWLARYPTATSPAIGDYSEDYAMWQYTDAGTVSGVSGPVDRNCVYRDFATYIKKYGYNGFRD